MKSLNREYYKLRGEAGDIQLTVCLDHENDKMFIKIGDLKEWTDWGRISNIKLSDRFKRVPEAEVFTDML